MLAEVSHDKEKMRERRERPLLAGKKKSYTVVSLEKKFYLKRLGKKLLQSFLNPTLAVMEKKQLNFLITINIFNLHSIIIFLRTAEGRICIKALPANSVKFGQDGKLAGVAGK